MNTRITGDKPTGRKGKAMNGYCCYHVEYKMYAADMPKGVSVVARSKADAYDKAVYEVIPEKEKHSPYSAWVVSATYANGNRRAFNTLEGKPY